MGGRRVVGVAAICMLLAVAGYGWVATRPVDARVAMCDAESVFAHGWIPRDLAERFLVVSGESYLLEESLLVEDDSPDAPPGPDPREVRCVDISPGEMIDCGRYGSSVGVPDNANIPTGEIVIDSGYFRVQTVEAKFKLFKWGDSEPYLDFERSFGHCPWSANSTTRTIAFTISTTDLE